MKESQRYIAPLAQSIVLAPEGSLLNLSGYGAPGQPGTDLGTGTDYGSF